MVKEGDLMVPFFVTQFAWYRLFLFLTYQKTLMKTYNQVEALVRKHFQTVNREGVGFLETNIINLTKELCANLQLPILISAKEYMELENPEFVGQTRLNKNGEYEMHWKLGDKLYYTVNKAPYFKPRTDERDGK